MFSILFHHPAPGREDYLIAELADCGTAGISEELSGIRAFFEEWADAQALIARFDEFDPEIRQEASIDWGKVSREAWPAFPVGKLFHLAPTWREDEPTPPGRIRLPIFPGMACGTGRHPATQLCLEAIESLVKPDNRVLDVGTGSGILAGAAALMGAGLVLACDSDAEVIPMARANYPAATFFAGSVDAVQSRWADVIVANIDAASIEQIMPELERVRKPGSTLILSGFPVWDTPEGVEPQETLQQGDWLCWIA